MQSSDFVSAHCFLHMFLFHSLQQGETPKNLAHKPQPQRCRRFIRSTSEFVWDTNRIRSILFDNGLTPKKKELLQPFAHLTYRQSVELLPCWHLDAPRPAFNTMVDPFYEGIGLRRYTGIPEVTVERHVLKKPTL